MISMEYLNAVARAGHSEWRRYSLGEEIVHRRASRCSISQDALRILEREFRVEVAETREAVEEAQRIRYEVYCIERQYEDSDTGLETDEYDHRSHHVILRHRRTGQAVGTVRLVSSRADADGHDLPIEQFCASRLLDHLPRRTTAEISRFAVSKRLRGITGTAGALIRIGLMRGIMQVSHAYGLTHWCAIMERSLLRLLGSTGVHFHPIGPLVEHRGLRQPAYAGIGGILARAYREEPDVWDFATLRGRLV
jgi:N-acyl-L-homoserine lactone synthetase